MLLIEQCVYDPPPLGDVRVVANVCACVPVEPVDTDTPAEALAEPEPLPLCEAPAEALAETDPAFAAPAPHATPIAKEPIIMVFVSFISPSPTVGAPLKCKAPQSFNVEAPNPVPGLKRDRSTTRQGRSSKNRFPGLPAPAAFLTS